MSGVEQDGFTAVAREQLPWLGSLARREAGDEAEDAVQECLLKAYRGFEDLRDVEAAPAWFRQILRNCIRDRRRRAARRPRQRPVDPLQDPDLHRRIAEQEPLPWATDCISVDFVHSLSREDVWRVLDRVPPPHHAPLVLVHMEGHTTAQVARMSGVARGTVLSWLHRGRRQFEAALRDYARDRDMLIERTR